MCIRDSHVLGSQLAALVVVGRDVRDGFTCLLYTSRAAKVIYKHAPRLYWFGTAVLTAALLIVTTAFLV